MSVSGGHRVGHPSGPARHSRAGVLAGRLAHWSAMRPSRVLVGGALVLVVSLLLLSRLHVTSSLAVMLGTHSAAAAAMQRVTTQYRAGDALLLLVELPAGRSADDAGRAELVDFATRLERAVAGDAAVAPLTSWVRFREDREFVRFVREVMLPGGVFYLGNDGAADLIRRMNPARMREQIARNEAMIGAPGPAGSAVSAGILRDPLRLLELLPADLKPVGSGVNVLADTSPAEAGRPEFADDGRALLIHIGASSVGNDYEAAGRLVDGIVRLAAKVNTGGLRVAPAGFAAIAQDSSRVIRRDSVVSSLVSIALLYALFVLFYRRWMAGVVIGGVAGVGMLAGIAVLSLMIKEVSPLAAMIAALLAGLGTDYGIHFLSHYDGYRGHGMGSVDASVETARHMAVPIVTNCFTSIFGFVSLWPSKIQMLSDFALMGAAGLIGALVALFVLMPAVLAVFDRRPGNGSTERAVFGRFAGVVARRPGTCMTSSLMSLGLVGAAAIAQGLPLQFESDLTVMHPRPSVALDATAEVIRRFASQGDLVPVEVRAESPEELVIAAHDAARALGSPACRAAGVKGVIGLHTLLPDPREAQQRVALMESVDPDDAVAAFDAAVEQSEFDPAIYRGYRAFLRLLLGARRVPTVTDVLKYRAVSERVFTTASLESGVPPTCTVLLARLSTPLHDRLQRKATVAALSDAAATVNSGRVTLAGIAAVSEELEEAARDGLPQSAAISFFLVLLWLAFVFRRPLDVVFALLPLVFAAGTTVLFIMAIGQRLNPINSVAIPLLDGIAVDAGVFLVSAYRSHGSTRDNLNLHLGSTTHAVLLSVGTTVTAFVSLCLAHTPAVRSLGFVSAVGIVASGVGALLVLMPLLIRRAKEPGSR